MKKLSKDASAQLVPMNQRADGQLKDMAGVEDADYQELLTNNAELTTIVSRKADF